MGFDWGSYTLSTLHAPRYALLLPSYQTSHFHTMHDPEVLLNNGTVIRTKTMASDMECANLCMLVNDCVYFTFTCYTSALCRVSMCKLFPAFI